MAAVDPYASQMCLLLEQMVPSHWYSMPRGILQLKKSFEDDIIDRTCKRAIRFNALSYQHIKRICEDFAPELIFASISKNSSKLDKGFGDISSAGRRVSMLGASALAFKAKGEFNAEPFLVFQDTVALAIKMTRKVRQKDQRIIIAGDADFLSNGQVFRSDAANSSLYLSLFRWLSNTKFPVDVSRPPTPDNQLVITREGVSYLNVTLLYLLPLLILIVGGITLIKRNRR